MCYKHCFAWFHGCLASKACVGPRALKERILSTDINTGMNPGTVGSTESLDLNEDIDLTEDENEGELRSSGTRSQWSASDMDGEDEELVEDVRASGGASGGGALMDVEGSMNKSESKRRMGMEEESEEDDLDLDQIEDILALPEEQFPRFTLAKNKARFLRMVSWYRNKKEWLEVAPLSGVSKLFKQQTKELVGIRASKLDYEMELETGTLTPSQRSYRRDELKMCKVHEKMAVNLIARMQVKIKSGRR